jgi:hypothetical protein
MRPDLIARVAAPIQLWKTPGRGHNSGTLDRQDGIHIRERARSLERDPEMWTPVFAKDRAKTKDSGLVIR